MNPSKKHHEAMTLPPSPAQMPLFITSSAAAQQPTMLHAPLSPLANHPTQWSPPSTRESDMPLSSSLLFITGTTPADFKSKKNMTRIRKKAMGSYLTREKKPGEGRADQKQQTREILSLPWTDSDKDVQTNPLDHELPSERIERRGTLARPTTSATDDAEHAISPLTTVAVTKPVANSVAVSQRESHLHQMARVPTEFILPSAPIVIPMRSTPYLIYNSYAPGPFESIGKPLDPFATIYQASNPQVSVESLKHHCTRSFGTRAMGIHWIPAVVDSPHAFLSTLCIASAHFDAIHGQAIESVQTLALRQEVMHLISQSLVNPQSRTNDYNIIALTQLMASEIVASQEIALSFHEAGMEVMINQRGGLEELGLKGRLAPVVTWVMLESSVLQERTPMASYAKYAAKHSSITHPSTATIPESPLYCPRGEYETLKRSASDVTPRMLDLLRDVRMMIDLFLHESKQKKHNSLSLKNIYRKIIEQYPTVAELQRTRALTIEDWRYEAMRITSIITATAIMRRVPLSEALQLAAELDILQLQPGPLPSTEIPISPLSSRHDSPTTSYSTASFSPTHPLSGSHSNQFSRLPSASPVTTLLSYLRSVLEASNLSQCWSGLGGVLLWIALTVGAASRQSDVVLKKWYRGLAVRISIVLCFEHPEAMLATLIRIGELVERVGDNPDNGDRSATGEKSEVGKSKADGQQRGAKRRRA
ncbi:unnamed protein product [Periconia digitata]|uniref:Uncharacterized protein n=1 Tax=Periconia digitata TaxID=1303443 RepID=A0A9W4XDH8_9PLEO|nr:unnamed protein product [Periconia digitata]